jgi:hypothetical protein
MALWSCSRGHIVFGWRCHCSPDARLGWFKHWCLSAVNMTNVVILSWRTHVLDGSTPALSARVTNAVITHVVGWFNFGSACCYSWSCSRGQRWFVDAYTPALSAATRAATKGIPARTNLRTFWMVLNTGSVCCFWWTCSRGRCCQYSPDGTFVVEWFPNTSCSATTRVELLAGPMLSLLS